MNSFQGREEKIWVETQGRTGLFSAIEKVSPQKPVG